ncbi:MAG: hypothetical protein ACLFQV_08725 [Vulcanimicrobiota bacterium]
MKSYNRTFFNIAVITVIFMIFLLSSIIPVTAQNVENGHWELVKVDNFGQNKPNIPARFKSREFFTGESRSGYVSGRYVGYSDSSKQKLEREAAGFVKWTPPPKIARPGEKWDGKYSAKILKSFNRTAEIMGYPSVVTLEIDTSWQGVSSTDQKHSAYYNQNVGIYHSNDNKSSGTTKKAEMVFPAKKQAGGKDYLVVAVGARLSMDGGDTYNYFYKWVPEKPREVTGHFRVIARNSGGGAVEGLEITVKNMETGKSKTMLTERDGISKESFEGKSGKVLLMVTEISLSAKTGYDIPLEGLYPSYIDDNKKISFPMKKQFEMNDSNNHMATYNLNVSIYKTVISASKWNDTHSRWDSCRASLLFKNRAGGKIFKISQNSFKKEGDKYSFTFYIPAREVLKEKVLSIFAFESEDKKTAAAKFTVPSLKSGSAFEVISIQLTDNAEKIARTKYKVYKYFLPLVGEKNARLFSNIKIDIDNSRGKPCYLDGVIYIPGNMDLTRDEFSETLMHEWTHHIMEIVAKDPDIEDKLGGKHDIWLKAPNKELAWDEGRAHFFSVLLTRGLDMPYNPKSFSKSTAQKVVKSIPDSGENVEGVVTAALIDYYHRMGYTKTKNVVSNFLEINELSKKYLGHPPRTSADFFKIIAKSSKEKSANGSISSGQAQKILNAVNEVKHKYSITD